MSLTLLSAAVLFLAAGHYFKMLRWKQFIEVYERPDQYQLLQALSLGYVVNFFIPFHAGDLFRIYWAGRRMKNGYGLSFATVIMDRYLDVIVVGFFFFLFWLAGFRDAVTLNTLVFYSGIAVLLLIASVFFVRYSSIPKKIMYRFAGFFNDSIELKLMNFFWSLISSFKNLFQKIPKKALLFNTAVMWGLYLVSYLLVGQYLSGQNLSGRKYRTVDVFLLLFSSESLNSAAFLLPGIMALYVMLPLFLLLAFSFFGRKHKKIDTEKENEYIQLLPHVNKKDRLQFLEMYFEGNRREYLNSYLTINSKVSILKDYSAGSNATTLLCMDQQQSFFRKYAFGEDGWKLKEQIDWLKEQSGILKVTDILRDSTTEAWCYYDMPYENLAISMFQYIHSMPVEKSKDLLFSILKDLDQNLYSKDNQKADHELVESYIRSKAIQNIETLYKARELRQILEYKEIKINGKSYHNFSYYLKRLSAKKLLEVFENDTVGTIHGDLTIENIICKNGEAGGDYYLIDPNTGNILNSPNLDYAKLLQSLHGGYEFLMNVKEVAVHDNSVDFLFLRSTAYDELLRFLKQYMQEHFSKEKRKSIYYHEILHWLRLMPYKLKKDGKKAMVFYAGMILVMNEILGEGEQDEIHDSL